MTTTEFALRAGAGMLCGTIIGFERALQGKVIGMRTLGLVGFGAAVLVAAVDRATLGNADAATRVIQGIVAGIGFLGAGVILHGRGEERAHGMTTAASIWVTAIVGIVAGMGQMPAALLSAVAAFGLLLLGSRFDRATPSTLRKLEGSKSNGTPPQ